ncbi:universal stress protein [Prosthecobacter vanneervenii]|uniref:Manganese transport protein n=1 Tax=Prosthecobacter vanneervenii TaxID=48466 RepID=A0A7W7YE07_9BACT|nr:universal stress protein [Prosthecobacter vanneervenii]MBB5034441.1 manganese transport protein [Prosthecobacter vanneervenii]
MYQKILVALDASASDQELLPAITQLATLMQSQLLLVHVADGWAARNFDQLKLAESEEMKQDLNYLETTAASLRSTSGLTVNIRLVLGEPPDQLLKVAAEENIDLIALASHGHRLIGDIIHGSTIDAVRHKATVPLFVVPPKRTP